MTKDKRIKYGILAKKLKSLTGQSRNYKIWTNMCLNKTLTKLSLESRMGKGKGPIYTEVLFLKKGSIIYEFENVKYSQVIEIFSFLEKQMSTKLQLIFKN